MEILISGYSRAPNYIPIVRGELERQAPLVIGIGIQRAGQSYMMEKTDKEEKQKACELKETRSIS